MPRINFCVKSCPIVQRGELKHYEHWIKASKIFVQLMSNDVQDVQEWTSWTRVDMKLDKKKSGVNSVTIVIYGASWTIGQKFAQNFE